MLADLLINSWFFEWRKENERWREGGKRTRRTAALNSKVEREGERGKGVARKDFVFLLYLLQGIERERGKKKKGEDEKLLPSTGKGKGGRRIEVRCRA